MQNAYPERPPCSNQIVVLVVDDESVICDLVKLALEGEGYFILTGADGQDALTISRSFGGTIHLLLTDVTMPRMSGLDLRERFEIERPGARVLLMSGQCDLPASVPLLRKPFSPSDLKQRVRQSLLEAVSA